MTTTTGSTTLIDPRQEAVLLDSYGLSYVERDVPLSEIGLEQSKDLNGRSETRANPDKITEYAIKMLDGEVFPYIVIAFDKATGKYLIWSGVHRTGGAIEAELSDTIHAFVVEIPAGEAGIEVITKLRLFSHESNARHGYGTSYAERTTSACDEFEAGGDLDDIAKRFGLRTDDITDALKERRLNFALRQHGISPAKIIRSSDKEAILRLPDEHLMRDVANLVDRLTIRDGRSEKPRHRITAAEVTDLVKDLRKEKAPSERARILTEAETLATSKKPTPKTRGNNRNATENQMFIWRGACTRLLRGFDERVLIEQCSTGDELDLVASDVKRLRGVLDALDYAIDRKRA